MAQTSIESSTLDSILMESGIRQPNTNLHTPQNHARYKIPDAYHNLINNPVVSTVFGAVALPLLAYISNRVSDGAVNADTQILRQLAFYGGLAGLAMGFLNLGHRKDNQT